MLLLGGVPIKKIPGAFLFGSGRGPGRMDFDGIRSDRRGPGRRTIMDSRTGGRADEVPLLFRKKATTDRTARSTITATPSIL